MNRAVDTAIARTSAEEDAATRVRTTNLRQISTGWPMIATAHNGTARADCNHGRSRKVTISAVIGDAGRRAGWDTPPILAANKNAY